MHISVLSRVLRRVIALSNNNSIVTSCLSDSDEVPFESSQDCASDHRSPGVFGLHDDESRALLHNGVSRLGICRWRILIGESCLETSVEIARLAKSSNQDHALGGLVVSSQYIALPLDEFNDSVDMRTKDIRDVCTCKSDE